MSVKDDVQQLSDDLEPSSALGYIRSLRVCLALDHTTARRKAHHEPSFGYLSDSMLVKNRPMNDHDWVSLADLLKRCSALSDLLFELRDQLPPCVLSTLHEYHPRCRLHMRSFNVRSLLTSEPDTHELAIASSPCLHSIWFSYMILEEDAYASRSQRVIQQVLANLAPNVEDVRFWRTRYSSPGGPGWQHTRLPMEKNSRNQSIRLRHLEVNAARHHNFVLTRQDLQSWHTHADFFHLHTLNLKSELDLDALRWLTECDFAALKVLSFQPHSSIHQRSSHIITALAKTFVVSLPPLSELTIEYRWCVDMMEAVYQRHGDSLHTLRLPQTDKLMPNEAAPMLTEIKDQCPLLTDFEITIVKDQGSRAEVAVYKALATFPCLRNLAIGFRTRYYCVEREQGRMPPYDRFDKKRSGRYGDMRRTFIDSAIDEDFANAVFHLVSPPDRLRRLEELRLLSRPRHPDGPKMQIYDIFKWMCRSWSVKLGVRDDRPNDVVMRELGTEERKRKGCPAQLNVPVEEIFRRIWPKKSRGWWDDWYSFLDLDDADVEMIRKSGWKIDSE